ncbi:MAG: PfkB family carbohydrate kinase [Chlamydiales bacterium]
MVNFEAKRILVAGDFMLDLYTVGDVERISPEAPVPILRVMNESSHPGGAGNTILNLISMGMEVVALGRVGNDEEGHHVIQSFVAEGVDVRGLVRDPQFRTPLKNRILAEGQQIVRVDYESLTPLDPLFEERICKMLPALLQEIDLVAISDYAKGFLTVPLLRELITLAESYKIPVIVDPKGEDFRRYRGVTLIKPNLSEAIAAAGLGRKANLDDIAAKILHIVHPKTLMITRSKEGISVFERGIRQDFPTYVHDIKDITGAGDTVMAMIAVALANDMPPGEAAELANVAASIAIEQVGSVRVSLAELSARLEAVYQPRS